MDDRRHVDAMPDALRVFTVLFAHNMALQVAKDVRTYGPSQWPHLVLLTLPLAACIFWSHSGSGGALL